MAMEFNPDISDSNEYVAVPHVSALNLTTKFSVLCWFYRYDWAAGHYSDMISKNDYYGIQFEPTYGYGQVLFRYGSFAWRNLDDNTAVPANTWLHIVGTYDNSLGSNQLKIYREGSLARQASYTDAILTVTDPLYIGKLYSGGANTRSFHGRLMDCRVYNRALSAAEVQSIFRGNGVDDVLYGLVHRSLVSNEGVLGTSPSGSGSVKDLSSLQNHGTPAGTPIYWRHFLQEKQEAL
jgi:hypothetical protein